MSKVKSTFCCQNCGAQHSKWLGQCSACKEWNTIVEEIIKKDKAVICRAVLLLAIKLTFTGLLPSCSVKNCLKEEIINSLDMIIIAGKTKYSFVSYETN